MPTALFFYGPEIDYEYNLFIEKGKSLIVRYLAKSETNKEGKCSVFFELNGQPRTIEVLDRNFQSKVTKKTKFDQRNSDQVGSPLPGQVSQIFIKNNDKITKGDKLLIIEAMKMETTIHAEKSGTIQNIQVDVGTNVEPKDLILEIIS